MSIWEESTKYLAGNKQTKQKVYFPCLAGFRVCTWEGKVEGMCRRLEQDGWECGGSEDGSIKRSCLVLWSSSTNHLGSHLRQLLCRCHSFSHGYQSGLWSVRGWHMQRALLSAVRLKAVDGGPYRSSCSPCPSWLCIQSCLSLFHVLICYPCVLRWTGSKGRMQVSGVGWGWRVRSSKVALGLAVNFFSFHWYF